jgi:hypothetical protein
MTDNDRAEGRTSHPDGAPDPFASSMRCAGELAGMLGGNDAMGMDHAELEDVIAERGRELMRRLLQDHLALRAAREQPAALVADAEGVLRGRRESGHDRALASVFGAVTVTRMAYRAPGEPTCTPRTAP